MSDFDINSNLSSPRPKKDEDNANKKRVPITDKGAKMAQLIASQQIHDGQWH